MSTKRKATVPTRGRGQAAADDSASAGDLSSSHDGGELDNTDNEADEIPKKRKVPEAPHPGLRFWDHKDLKAPESKQYTCLRCVSLIDPSGVETCTRHDYKSPCEACRVAQQGCYHLPTPLRDTLKSWRIAVANGYGAGIVEACREKLVKDAAEAQEARSLMQTTLPTSGPDVSELLMNLLNTSDKGFRTIQNAESDVAGLLQNLLQTSNEGFRRIENSIDRLGDRIVSSIGSDEHLNINKSIKRLRRDLTNSSTRDEPDTPRTREPSLPTWFWNPYTFKKENEDGNRHEEADDMFV